MSNKQNILKNVSDLLGKGIQGFPEGFYDSFEYTETGNNFTHPWTLGLLAKILWSLPDVTMVAIDARFNIGNGTKFQPDLTAYVNSKSEPFLFIDYESPNSSDARVPDKDVHAYLSWRQHQKTLSEYIIITSLPNRRVPHWQIRYTSKDGCNYPFRNHSQEIRDNPFEFWYSHYLHVLKESKLNSISFLNIDGKKVSAVHNIGR